MCVYMCVYVYIYIRYAFTQESGLGNSKSGTALSLYVLRSEPETQLARWAQERGQLRQEQGPPREAPGFGRNPVCRRASGAQIRYS